MKQEDICKMLNSVSADCLVAKHLFETGDAKAGAKHAWDTFRKMRKLLAIIAPMGPE